MRVIKDRIFDESEARAFIKGEFRRLRYGYLSINEKNMKKIDSLNVTAGNIYSCERDTILEAMSDLILGETVLKKGRRREITEFVYLGAISLEQEAFCKMTGEKLYPICRHRIERWSPLANGGYGIKVIFYISEHAMARILTRSSNSNFKTLVETVRSIFYKLDYFFLNNKFNKNEVDDFVLLMNSCYIPFSRDKELDSLIMKTWVPVESWDERNSCRLSNYCNALGDDECRMFSMDEFKSKVYFAPEI